VPDPGPDDCLGLRVGSLWRRIDRLFERAFAPYGLGHAQAQLLLALLEHGPLPVHALARRCGYEESTTSRLVKHLKDRGFVLVRPDPADRRTRLVRAAAQARHLAQALTDVRDRINRRLARDLPEEDLAALRRVAAALDAARRHRP